MAKYNDTVRIFGEAIGESDAWIDAKIEGYALGGNLKLVEDTAGNPREWELSDEDLADLEGNQLLIPHEDLENPNHPVWDMVGEMRHHANDEAFSYVQDDMRGLGKEVFKKIVEAEVYPGEDESSENQ